VWHPLYPVSGERGYALRDPGRVGRVGAAVERLILDSLAAGHPTIDGAARQLGIPVRTLQRRLREAGLSYRQLVDTVRFDEACRLLGDPRARLADVATVLGFADPGNFRRAFKRWSGVSPRDFRRLRRTKPRAAGDAHLLLRRGAK